MEPVELPLDLWLKCMPLQTLFRNVKSHHFNRDPTVSMYSNVCGMPFLLVSSELRFVPWF